MAATFRYGLIPTLGLVPGLSCIGVGLLAGLGSAGWIFDIEPLRRMAPDGAVMRPSVIIMLCICSGALWLISRRAAEGRRLRIAQAMAVIVAICSAYALSGFAFSLDEWVFAQNGMASGTGGSDRIAANTAFNLFLTSIALLTLNLETHSRRAPAQVLGFVVGVIGLMALLGYGYGAGDASGLGVFDGPSMAVPSAFAFLLLAAGILCVQPESGLMAVVTSASAGGFLARRLLVAAILIPATLGWLKVVGDRLGAYDAAMGAALLVGAHIILFLIVIWNNAEALHLVDLQRLQAEADLRLSRDDLEQQVIKRTGELRQSEELKTTALNALPQHIVVLDQAGTIIEANQAWQSFIRENAGVSSGQALGVGAGYDVGAGYIDALRKVAGPAPELSDRVEAAIGALLAGGEDSFSQELSFDLIAENKWFLLTAVPLRRESGGVVVAHTNISERKRSEEAARKSADILRRLQTVTDSALSRLSFETLIREMLLRVCEALRADAASLLLLTEDGRALTVRAAVGMDEEVEAGVVVPIGEGVAGRIAETRQPLLIDNLSEMQVVSPVLRDGFCSLVGAPMMAASKLIGVIHAQSQSPSHFFSEDLRMLQLAAERIAVAIERAQLYKAEQQSRIRAEQASRMKDEFLAVVSHELRSPLNTILGWVTLLRGGRLKNEEVDRALEAIERSARSQDRIVGDLLDVSRIVTGKLQMNIRAVEPAGVIAAAIEDVRPAAEAKSISLQLTLDKTAGTISADSDRLQQIIWNLVSNAIRFTPRAGRIEVRLERVNSHVEIVVSDTGRGIRPDFLPFIFDRFSQADSSSTRKTGGLGLGLAIVRHLVELQGGEVTVESAGEGQGATFVIKLPLLISKPSGRLTNPVQLSLVEHRELDCPPALNGLRVLVVDADADARELVRTILVECEADVKTAASVDEALVFLRDTSWQLEVIISSIEMPDLDGYALIRHVRAMELEGAMRVPAVALTAYAGVEDRMRALGAGFQMHVPKPVEPAELLTVVASLAGRIGRLK